MNASGKTGRETTNLGVRSSNLFGRASDFNELIRRSIAKRFANGKPVAKYRVVTPPRTAI
jgi:hypothetical protein